jgi:hypothetical protein
MEQFANGTPAGQLGDVEWRKGSRSHGGYECIEVAVLPDGSIGMRNSRDPGGPALVYTRRELAAFIAGAQAGEFDDLAV